MGKLRKILMDDALAEKFYDSKLGGGNPLPQFLKDIFLSPSRTSYVYLPYTNESPEIKDLLDRAIDVSYMLDNKEILDLVINTPYSYDNAVAFYRNEGESFYKIDVFVFSLNVWNINIIFENNGGIKYISNTPY